MLFQPVIEQHATDRLASNGFDFSLCLCPTRARRIDVLYNGCYARLVLKFAGNGDAEAGSRARADTT